MQIVLAPNPILRSETKLVTKITPNLIKTVREMIRMTESFKDPEGVGLASTQVGLDGKFFVAKFGKKFVPVFNPEIITSSKKQKLFFEGCLSIPDIYGELERPIAVSVRYMDDSGKQVKTRLTGLSAWVFQHEVDHLRGSLFIDKVLRQHGKVFKVVGKDQTGADIFEEVETKI